MKKAINYTSTMTIETHIPDYYIEIVQSIDTLEAWLIEKNYSIKYFMIGIEYNSKNDIDELIEICENEIEDFYIPEYNYIKEKIER